MRVFYVTERIYDRVNRDIIGYMVLYNRSLMISVIRVKEIIRMLRNGELISGLYLEKGELVEDTTVNNMGKLYVNNFDLHDMPAKIMGEYGAYIRVNTNKDHLWTTSARVAIFEDKNKVCYVEHGYSGDISLTWLVVKDKSDEFSLQCVNINKNTRKLVDVVWYGMDLENVNNSLALMGYRSNLIGSFGMIDLDNTGDRFTLPYECTMLVKVSGVDRMREVIIGNNCDYLIAETDGYIRLTGIGNARVIGNVNDLVIPEGTLEFTERCETILPGAFAYSLDVKELDLSHSSVEIIANKAFESSKIEKANLLGVLEIGLMAFRGCERLAEIVFDKKLGYIGESAFEFSGLRVVHLWDSLQWLEKNAFGYCKDLVEVRLGANIRELKDETFIKCTNLEEINTENIRMIGNNCFEQCQFLGTLDLRNLKAVGKGVLNQAYVKKLILGDLDDEVLVDLLKRSVVEELIIPRKHIKRAKLVPCRIIKITALEDWVESE